MSFRKRDYCMQTEYPPNYFIKLKKISNFDKLYQTILSRWWDRKRISFYNQNFDNDLVLVPTMIGLLQI